MIRRLLSFWEGPFSGAMLVLGRVVTKILRFGFWHASSYAPSCPHLTNITAYISVSWPVWSTHRHGHSSHGEKKKTRPSPVMKGFSLQRTGTGSNTGKNDWWLALWQVHNLRFPAWNTPKTLKVPVLAVPQKVGICIDDVQCRCCLWQSGDFFNKGDMQLHVKGKTLFWSVTRLCLPKRKLIYEHI